MGWLRVPFLLHFLFVGSSECGGQGFNAYFCFFNKLSSNLLIKNLIVHYQIEHNNREQAVFDFES